MKKLISLLTLLAVLAIPVAAMAVKAGDWELVGYTKLETFWDSAQINKNLSGPIVRHNAAQPNAYGRLKFTAQSSRFGLKINGPEVLGAKTQGYIEMDFDSNQDGRQTASNSYIPRMRHAWFRMDWPGGWQLLMGQYWGVFCDFYPETVNDGPYQNHGQATQRIPQARLSYKTGPWTFSGLVGVAYDPAGDNVTNAVNNNFGTVILPGSGAASTANGALWGQNTCVPQVQGQVIFEKDLYGKAAFANRPRGFVVDVGAGFQQTTYMGGQIFGNTWGQNNFTNIGTRGNIQKNNQTLTPWVVQGTLFIPILVTHTDNLKGTASVTIQAHIGQGFSFFGNGADGDNSFFMYDGPSFVGITNGANPTNVNYVQVVNYNRRLTPKYGGYIQGQYYFTNEVYASVVYGFDKAYGISQDRNFGINSGNGIAAQDAANFQQYTFLSNGDLCTMNQEVQGNLFWTPSKNLKFGVGYSYLRSTYFQMTTVGSERTRFGQNHSVRFGGWFFF
jgi:hypothetical protein